MQNDDSYQSLLYNRQFIAGPRVPPRPSAWGSVVFASRLWVTYHASLNVTKAVEDDREVLCLGHIFDPNHPSHTDQDIAERLVRSVTSFMAFEHATAQLAGRWVLFVSLGGQARLYPDAGGTKSAFYTVAGPQSELWIGSQPRLISEAVDVTIDTGTLEAFCNGTVKNSWPGDITPYENIRQLLPNHYVDLSSGEVRRFWPLGALPHYDTDTAAKKIGETLSAIMTSVAARRHVAMPLTGGYDSRVLLACSGERKKDLEVFVVIDPGTPSHDTSIPKRLMSRLGLKGRILHAKRFDKAFWDIYRQNVAEMFWDKGSTKFFTFTRYGHGWFVATGNIAELIRRCSYYRDGIHPSAISPAFLAQKAGYEGNPVAIRAFERWLRDVPQDMDMEVLDLFYWEHRVGNWVSMGLTGLDTVCEVIPMYNCRTILEAGVTVDIAPRLEPYQFFRRICEMFEPVTVSFPFNDGWKTRAMNWVSESFPRVAYRALWVRNVLEGFYPYYYDRPTVSGIGGAIQTRASRASNGKDLSAAQSVGTAVSR